MGSQSNSRLSMIDRIGLASSIVALIAFLTPWSKASEIFPPNTAAGYLMVAIPYLTLFVAGTVALTCGIGAPFLAWLVVYDRNMSKYGGGFDWRREDTVRMLLSLVISAVSIKILLIVRASMIGA